MPGSSTVTDVAVSASAPVIQNVLSGAANTLSKQIGRFAKSFIDHAAVELRLGFEEYLNLSYRKCEKFKTILNPNEPLNVKDFYVNVDFTCGNEVITDLDLIEQISDRKYIVVTGLAGGGKSMFMKYMTIEKYTNSPESMPLFIELRHINSFTSKDLLSFIRTHCAAATSKLSEDQFKLGLKAGAFTLILDGFDEVNYESRDEIQAHILDLQKKYPYTKIIVSSRPDERFGGWTSFFVFRVNALSKPQTVKLIKSLRYDPGVKKRFVKEVTQHLYQSHTSFLSSPLLTTIMLLTFEEFAEIPDKMHAFYSQAFDTLFQKHDAQKEQYQRKIRTGLTREEFKGCFAAFCAMSYIEERFSFSESALEATASTAIRYIKQTNGSSFKNLTTKHLIDDLRESVCMLQPDGLDISFVHRSFQEYFSAVFATSVHSSKLKKLLDKFALRFGDSVIMMARDMDRESIEQEWVIPTIQELSEIFRLNSADEMNTGDRLSFLVKEVRFRISPEPVYFSFSGFQYDVLGRLDALCRLYPKHLKGGFPFIFLSHTSIEYLKSVFLKDEYKSKKDFNLIEKFLSQSEINDRAGILRLGVSGDASWWLDALEVKNAYIQMAKGFTSITKDINSREKRRSLILEDFI